MRKIVFFFFCSLLISPVSGLAGEYKDPELAGKLNPHWSNKACLECHLEKPRKGKKTTYKFGGDFIKLCNSCHDTAISRFDEHIVDVLVPPKGKEKYFKTPPLDFPLNNGKLTCITCHNLRLQESSNPNIKEKNPYFLRRAPFETQRTFEWAKSEIDERFLQTRYTFCFFCHMKGPLMQFSPHKNQLKRNGEINEDVCLFCHTEVPDRAVFNPAENRKLSAPMETQCKNCHMGKTRLHPIRVNHYSRMPPDRIIAMMKFSERRIGLVIPRSKGRIVCSSCHNAHQRGVLKNPITRKGADSRKRLRVEGYGICLTCHGESVGTPASGRPF
jgi:hypothetical protein